MGFYFISIIFCVRVVHEHNVEHLFLYKIQLKPGRIFKESELSFGVLPS